MNGALRYLEYVKDKLQDIMDTQIDQINQAAELVSKTCLADGRFYVFGSGHSHMIAEEVYARAGGLAMIKPILPTELMVLEMPTKSTHLERLEGYAAAILSLYHVEAKDTLMVISNSGRNAVPVEMCMEAKKLGANVIALTSLSHSQNVSSRHSSGKRLFEIADVVLDNQAVKGDAGLYIDGFDVPVGPISNITGIALSEAVITQAVEYMVHAGIKPPVFKSSNLDGADEYNNALFDTYYKYWK